EIREQDAALFISLRDLYDMSPVFIHTSYLINVASRDGLLRKKSIAMLIEEMNRADVLGADYVVLHTGSASGEEDRVARERAVSALRIVAESGAWKAGLLIENTAGERGDISSTVNDLSEIKEAVKGSLVSGICIDTCHAFAAGYNIREAPGREKLIGDAMRHLGRDSVKLIHLNDSKGDAGSRIDRHEHIGRGRIGPSGLKRFITDDRLSGVPLILETPKKSEHDDILNLRRVRRMLAGNRISAK
ncbi:MAG: deoxyribonuclease IV, partial [Nitrospirota bacterium]